MSRCIDDRTRYIVNVSQTTSTLDVEKRSSFTCVDSIQPTIIQRPTPPSRAHSSVDHPFGIFGHGAAARMAAAARPSTMAPRVGSMRSVVVAMDPEAMDPEGAADLAAGIVMVRIMTMSAVHAEQPVAAKSRPFCSRFSLKGPGTATS